MLYLHVNHSLEMLRDSPIIDRTVTGSLRIIVDVGGGFSSKWRPAESIGPIALRQRPFVAWRPRVGRVLLWQFVERPRYRRGLLRSGSTRKSEARSAWTTV